MKSISFAIIAGLFLFTEVAMAQDTKQIDMADSTGLPGDHFSLQGALGLFKESTSLEDFEKRLNLKNNAVNNLDLNSDGKVDYVRVVADKKDHAHILMLQVPVSKTEIQDVAVIEIEKSGEKQAYLQILGDETLYGETIMVEPKEGDEPSDPGVIKKGPSAYSPGSQVVFVNVWYWPCVTYIYEPVYVVYISPWYWDFYPAWWNPWYPFTWRYFHMHNWHWHHHYHYASYHRTTFAHQVYTPRRSTSRQVNERYRDAQIKYKKNQGTHPRPGSINNPVRTDKDVVKPGARPVKQPAVRPNQPQTKPGVMPDPRPQNPVKQAPRPTDQDRPQTKPDKQPDPRPMQPGVRPAPHEQKAPKAAPQSNPRTPKSSQPQQRKPQSKNKQR